MQIASGSCPMIAECIPAFEWAEDHQGMHAALALCPWIALTMASSWDTTLPRGLRPPGRPPAAGRRPEGAGRFLSAPLRVPSFAAFRGKPIFGTARQPALPEYKGTSVAETDGGRKGAGRWLPLSLLSAKRRTAGRDGAVESDPVSGDVAVRDRAGCPWSGPHSGAKRKKAHCAPVDQGARPHRRPDGAAEARPGPQPARRSIKGGHMGKDG